MDPLDILPPELWERIFEELEHPQDWLNLYRASPAFEGIVGTERPQALMSQVFPLVEKHLDLKVNLKELLGLRLVSRQWKKLVDTTLETPEAVFGTDVQEHKHEQLYNFMGSVSISSFLEKFGGHPGNPFVGRTVKLYFIFGNNEEVMAEYTHSVLQLMERFGDHIRKLYVGAWLYRGTNATMENFLHRLKSVLGFVPNLESLVVSVSGRGDIDYRLETPILGDQHRWDQPEWMEREMVEFGVWNLLPQLRKIRLDGSFMMGADDEEPELKAYMKIYSRLETVIRSE